MEFNKKPHECIFLSDCDFYIQYIAYSSQNCGTKKCRKRYAMKQTTYIPISMRIDRKQDYSEQRQFFRLFLASALCSKTFATLLHESISLHSAQVSNPRSTAHLRISHIVLQ